MTNQQRHTRTSTPDKNVKNIAAKPEPHCVDDFDSRTDLDGKNDSGPDPEIHDQELHPNRRSTGSSSRTSPHPSPSREETINEAETTEGKTFGAGSGT